MDRLCSAPQCVEFNQSLLQDIMDLRREMVENLTKTDRIIGILGGTSPPALPAIVTEPSQDEIDQTKSFESGYLDLGLRLNANDYNSTDIGTGRATTGIFNKSGPKKKNESADIDSILAAESPTKRLSIAIAPSPRKSTNKAPQRSPMSQVPAMDIDSILGGGDTFDIDAMLGAADQYDPPPTVPQSSTPQASIYAKNFDQVAYTPAYAKSFGLPTTVRDFKAGTASSKLVYSPKPSVKANYSGDEKEFSTSRLSKFEVASNRESVVEVERVSSKSSLPMKEMSQTSSAMERDISKSSLPPKDHPPNIIENDFTQSSVSTNDASKIELDILKSSLPPTDIQPSKLIENDPSNTSLNSINVVNTIRNHVGEPDTAIIIPEEVPSLEKIAKMALSENDKAASNVEETHQELSNPKRQSKSLAFSPLSFGPASSFGREAKRETVDMPDVKYPTVVEPNIARSIRASLNRPQKAISITVMKDATNEKTVADLKAQIKLPSKPPPKLNLSRSQTQNRSIQKKSIRSKLFEKNGSMSSIDSNDEPSGLYPSLDGDLPKHSYRGLNAKKKAAEVEERHIVNINNDEEHDGDSSISSRSSSPKLRTYKSNMSIATTDIPRYTFAPMKNEGSTFYLNDTRNLPVKSPKPALARSYSALHAVMKRDRVDKPVSEFDPQNKNTVAMQAERSRRASKAFSILPGTRRTSSSNNRRDSSAIRKQSLAPSTATPQTPNYTIASASSIHRSFISVLAPAQDPIQLSLYQRFLCLIILPAYDNKGRKLTLDQFDEADFDAISFVVNGFHPKSYFVTLWDFLISLVYGAALWIIPFLTSYVSQLSTEFVAQCSFWFTLLFAIDSIIYLITPQPVVVNPMGSFREYESMRPALFDWLVDWLRGSLIFEVASLIPFEMIFHGVDNYIFFFWLRFLRFYRVPDKLSRCAYFTKAKLMLEKQMGMGFCKVIPIALLIFYFIHFNACAMYLTGSHSDFMGWKTTWPQFNPTEVYNVYTWTFFQAVGNIFPMSFKPQTAMEQAFAIVFIVIGAVLYAAFVGYVSSAAMSINPSGRLYNQKMEELIDYVKWKNLSKQTKEKLVSYYETKYRGKFFEEDTLLQDMNESLREEISMHNTQTLIEKVPFLQRNELDGRDEIFFRRIATVLHARYFIPGDYIIKQGDSGNEMYFILSGKVNVYVNGVKVVSLYDGAYLGEVSLITRHLRTATVQAVLPCVLYKLTRHDFHTVINEFPDMRIRIDKLAREAERMVKQAEDAKP